MKTEISIKKAFNVQASYSDFNGNLDKWKDSCYQLFRLQMTWSFAYNIDIKERKSGVYVDLIIKPAFKDECISTMGEFGFRQISCNPIDIGMVDGYSLYSNDADIDYIEVEY